MNIKEFDKKLSDLIAIALKEHEEKTMADESVSEDTRLFICQQTRYAAQRLKEIAQMIRGKDHLRIWRKHGRVPDNIMEEMLSWGQPFARFLWLANLRHNVTDPIEQTYGISFSSLSIYEKAIRHDGKICFIMYNPRRTNHGDSYTLGVDGKIEAVSIAEFDALYNLFSQVYPDGEAPS